jgi:hypothetical protein
VARPLGTGRLQTRKEHPDETKAVGKTVIQRLLSRRDIPLRERTLVPGRLRAAAPNWVSAAPTSASATSAKRRSPSMIATVRSIAEA